MQSSCIVPFLKSRVLLLLKSALFFLSDLPLPSGVLTPLGMKAEFVHSSSQVNTLKIWSFDKLLWFTISWLKKLNCVNHLSSESYIPAKGSQQKEIYMSIFGREKTGKIATNNI